MAQNEFSLKPTLEIDKSKDIQSLNSVITDIKKGGKNNTFNIINNHDTSDKEKYLSLWEENNRLISIINEIQSKLTELENELNYNEYLFYTDKSDNYLGIKFENKLLEKDVKDYQRKVEKQNLMKIYYYVNKNDWSKFLECREEYEKEKLNANSEYNTCKDCSSIKNEKEREINNKINALYKKYSVNDKFYFDNKATHLEKVELNKLIEHKSRINNFLIKENLCSNHNK